jgi:hypothetical protein
MELKVKKDEYSGEHYFDISDFSEYYDTEKISSYEYVVLDNGELMLVIYDKDGNILKPIK